MAWFWPDQLDWFLQLWKHTVVCQKHLHVHVQCRCLALKITVGRLKCSVIAHRTLTYPGHSSSQEAYVHAWTLLPFTNLPRSSGFCICDITAPRPVSWIALNTSCKELTHKCRLAAHSDIHMHVHLNCMYATIHRTAYLLVYTYDNRVLPMQDQLSE